jgi:molybdopterin converting factor small subunit
MPITVYLHSTLRPHAAGAETLTITQPVQTIAELVIALERQAPRVAAELADSMFTFVVNDETLRGGVLQHPVREGDRVEIVPASPDAP